MAERLSNWAGNVVFGARRVHRPSSVPQLQRLVAGSRRIRALGSGHSFNGVADTTAELVMLDGLPPEIDIDTARATVTVAAGVRYGRLAERLHAAGHALPNLGSLPHMSVAGACATATHGSGDRNGNLATAVSALELVTRDGELVTVCRAADGDRFEGMVVALGALGIVTRLTLDVVPTFQVRQYVYENLPLEQFEDNHAGIFAGAYSVSMFTDWAGPRINQVWLKHRADQFEPSTAEPPWVGAIPADGPRQPIDGLPATHCTEQLGVPGPWHARLPHFRADFTPSSGDELQSEYFLPRRLTIDAITAIDRLRDRIAPLLQICEIRTVAADDLWLSPCYHRDSVTIHFTWVNNQPAVTAALAELEEPLAAIGARPHWGKLFGTRSEQAIRQYERLTEFRRLLHHYDPNGKFGNDFTDRYLGQGAAADYRGPGV